MERFVISIGREIGSGGKEIAEKLAKRLNVSVYDKKLLEVAAQESGLDAAAFENVDEQESGSFLGGMVALRNVLAGYFNADSCMNSDALFGIQSEAIRTIAERESCITIGRCSEYVLRDHPCMISIFITADCNDRIQRIMQKEGLSEEKAREFMERGDRKRKSYHDYYATTQWGAAHSSDLCVNSSRLGIDGTVDFIYQYIRSKLKIE